jgi:hypothetical protein
MIRPYKKNFASLYKKENSLARFSLARLFSF